MAEPKPILIAEIGAAHGVRGEVRVKAHTADPLAIADYGPLSDGKGRVFKVKSLRHLKDDMLVVAFEGVAEALAVPGADIRLFGKPESFERRRMGVALARASDLDEARERALKAAAKVRPVKA